MRLATVNAGGATRFGPVVEGGFIDLSDRLRGRIGARFPEAQRHRREELRREQRLRSVDVTRDEIPDWKKLALTTRLNANEMQKSALGMLMWDLEFIISYVSTITRLEPGDAISTGTPAGVGHRRIPPVFMKAGVKIEQ